MHSVYSKLAAFLIMQTSRQPETPNGWQWSSGVMVISAECSGYADTGLPEIWS